MESSFRNIINHSDVISYAWDMLDLWKSVESANNCKPVGTLTLFFGANMNSSLNCQNHGWYRASSCSLSNCLWLNLLYITKGSCGAHNINYIYSNCSNSDDLKCKLSTIWRIIWGCKVFIRARPLDSKDGNYKKVAWSIFITTKVRHRRHHYFSFYWFKRGRLESTTLYWEGSIKEGQNFPVNCQSFKFALNTWSRK